MDSENRLRKRKAILVLLHNLQNGSCKPRPLLTPPYAHPTCPASDPRSVTWTLSRHPEAPPQTPGLFCTQQPPCSWAQSEQTAPPRPPPGPVAPTSLLRCPHSPSPPAAPGPGRDEPRPDAPTDTGPHRPLRGTPAIRKLPPAPCAVGLAASPLSSG